MKPSDQTTFVIQHKNLEGNISQLSLWPLLPTLPTAAWGAFSCHEKILWGERVRVLQPKALPSHLGAFCILGTFLGRSDIRMHK